ncbi:RHS repeat-associated core domain-containing protein, partial [Acidovorax sp. SUPP950]|uniref:RHS repeat-associated core domain-containing protein n=1 Tax=Acidovorax sp. SUPP950 TaxID=511901 RepID=UPI0024E0444B
LITGFGEANPTTGATGYAQSGQGSAAYAEAIKFDLRYPGQVFDEETQLNYNLHRSYDPPSGRYFQVDPIGLDGGWNRFGYVEGNPASYTDPLGLWAVSDLLPQSLVNTSAGVGDGILSTLSFGFVSGQKIRNGLNVQSVDKCSVEYRAGQVAGTAATMAVYAGGAIPKTLTHFTTSAGAIGIARSGAILPSTGLTLFGGGVYATAGSRIFVPGAAQVPLAVSGSGFMRLVPNAAFLNGGSFQTGLIFSGYGVAANLNAEMGGCVCR